MRQSSVLKIRTSAKALPPAPDQGPRHPGCGPGIGRVTKDRTIFCFDRIEDRQTRRIRALFFGGPDHDARILAPLLTPD